MHHIDEIELKIVQGDIRRGFMQLFVMAEMVGYDVKEWLVELQSPRAVEYANPMNMYLQQTYTSKEDKMREILAVWKAVDVAHQRGLVSSR